MNAITSTQLANILASPALKSKHLSTDNFFNVIALKKKLKDHITMLIEAEQVLSTEYGATEENVGKVVTLKCDNPEFYEKLSAIQQKEHELTARLNFLPKEEFKAFVNEIDVEAAAFLYEHLAVKE